MRNLYTVIMAIVLVMSATGLVLAQNAQSNTQVTTTLDSNDVYTIVAGDSLAALSPEKWKDLKAMNPYLDAASRTQVRADGWTKVLIYPGEQLKGLRSLGIDIVNGSVQAVPSPSPSPTAKPSPAPKGTTENESFLWTALGWMLWLLPLLLALALAYVIYLLWFSRNRRNASGAGPKYVNDGLRDNSAHTEFLRQAQRGFGTGTAPIDSFQIRNLRRRRASGTVVVGYKDGTEQTRLLDNEVLYLADLEYPDGTVRRDVMLLSACGNPLRRSGNVASYAPGFGFRFTDEQPQVVRIPEPQPDVETEQPRRVAAESRDGVFFTEDGNVAMISLNGSNIEMVTDKDIFFAFERNGDANSISVFKDDVTMSIENGRITQFGKKIAPAEPAAETATEETETKVASATKAQ